MEDSLKMDSEEELFEHYSFIVDRGQEIIRVDKFLIDKLSKTSRNKIQLAAKNGNILVNNHTVKPNYKVKPADRISLVLPYPVRELKLIPENIPIQIIYEDTELVVVNKPSNMVVHPAYGNYTGTLVNALVYHFDNLPQMPQDYYGRPGLVHRIDKHTTGLLVIAKTENALLHLANQFYCRSIEREYLALVWGNLETDNSIEAYIGRSLKDRKKMTVFSDESHGKYAKTNYSILEKYGFATLISCKLETGRTHQIRVHLKHIGHPLFNDLDYNGDKILKGPSTNNFRKFIENLMKLIPGQALHARKLGFIHPTTNKKMTFHVDPPIAFNEIINKCRNFLI